MMDVPLQGFDFSVLDDREFKEDAVREEIVAPLIRALGYGPTGSARVVRSRKLEHPYVSIGVTKQPIRIIPDYLMLVNERPRWVLDAKAPTEPVDDPDHVAQAYSYAIHHEVRVQWFALCNGHELALYNVADAKSIPRARFKLAEIEKWWQEALQQLFPPAMAHDPGHPFAKDFGMHLKRLGMPESTLLGFPGVPVRTIARIEDNLYGGFGMTLHSEGSEYAVFFEFEKPLLDRLLTLIAPAVDRERAAAYLATRPPTALWLDGTLPKVTVYAQRKTDMVENDREIFLPLAVTSFEPFQSAPDL